MLLRSLRLRDFRAHAASEVAFAPGVNLLVGPNGAGKTNVLEAVHYLCLTKSFRSGTDAHALRHGQGHFEIEGVFEPAERAAQRVRLAFVPDGGKRVFINRAPLDRLADLVGQFPVVVLAPEDGVLTAGGPEERRRFLDTTLSQARPTYLADAMRYRRALRQRNALLQQMRRSRSGDPGGLDAWTAELVTLGARIIARRHAFTAEFARYLAEAYARLDAVGEEPTLEYQTAIPLPEAPSDDPVADEVAHAEAFAQAVARRARRERELGRTLLGPHRDELVFRLNGFEVRPYASQGQHRTFALALKLAQFFYLQEHLGRTPLLLLDDVFGILDARRTEVILELLQGEAVGQSLLTAADATLFGTRIWEREGNRLIRVEAGRIEPEAVAPEEPEAGG